MYIKRLQNEEILDGMHLVWEVFAEELAPSYTPEGVAAFQRLIKMDNLMPQVAAGEIAVFGAMEKDELCGVGAVRRDGHILLLFVRKCWQRHGAARLLTYAIYQHTTAQLALTRMTVNAAPQAVEAYRHLGFREVAPEQEAEGIRFVPMERLANPGDIRPQKKGGMHKGLIWGLIVAILVLFLAFCLLFGKILHTVWQDVENRRYTAPYEQGGEEENPLEKYFGDGEDADEPDDDEAQGIEGVECYEEPNLPYTIKEETYTYHSNGTEGEYPMEFDVRYPQIEGLEGEKVDEINRMLKECAMTSVDTMYLNPSDSMKEAMLQEKQPFMASKVIYKVTYAGADFISVAFSDEYYVGNYYAGYVDLRTRNIRLSDAECFETADIVDLNETFMKDWLERMKEEAPGSAVLTGLKMSQFRKILGGEILENRYYDNFFVDAEGIEIGMTYHYQNAEEETVERGWITAPFDMDEILQYKTDSDFWNLVKSSD